MKKEVHKGYFSFVLVFVLLVKIYAQADRISIVLDKIEDLDMVELHYPGKGFHKVILRHLDNNMPDGVRSEFDATRYLVFEDFNRHVLRKQPSNKLYNQGNYIKRSAVTSNLQHYAISLVRYYTNKQLVETGLADDLILWSKKEGRYQLAGIYPEAIGGCMYCKSELYYQNQDTVVFEARGLDGHDVWATRSNLVIKDDTLKLCVMESIRGYDNHSPGEVYPYNIARHRRTISTYYDDQGNVSSRNLSYSTRTEDGKPIIVALSRDSLALYEFPAGNPNLRPVHVKDIAVRDISLQIASPRGRHIPVFWDGTWYQAKSEDIMEKP